MAAKDISIDTDGDLLITAGDFVVDLSDEQHVQHILESHRGEWKQSPLIGIGISNYINAPMTQLVRRQLGKNIKGQLEYDGMKVNGVTISSLDNVLIDAFRPD